MTEPLQLSRAGAWLLAARPKTLAAASAPVFLGCATAAGAGRFQPWTAVVILVSASLIQIGTNLVNDLADFQKGADSSDRLGPPRAVQMGYLTPVEACRGSVLVFLGAILSGAYLVYLGGWPIALVGVSAVASGIAYTAGPWPLGYHGLGDLFVFVFFGPVAVAGTHFLQAGPPTEDSLLAGVAAGLLSTAILVVNNYRDMESDARVGKRTTAVRMGRRATKVYYAALLATAYGLVFWVWMRPGEGSWLGLLPFVSLPLAFGRAKVMMSQKTDGHSLNRALEGTAKILALFSLLWIPGLAGW